MAQRRVLITGASGEITRQLLPTFRDHYELVLLDTRQSTDANDIINVDVSDPDIEKYREYFRGIYEIIVSQAAYCGPHPSRRSWSTRLP